MNPVLRAFNAQVDDVNNADRSITAKISTFSVDRHNTVFDARGCDLRNYNNNRVVLWEHSRDPARGSMPIGTNLWIRVDRSASPKLIARTKFKKDDFSQQLFEAYRDNEMSGWSLSAMPTDFGPPTPEEIRSRPELATVDLMFRKYDLCEYSAVAVPSCADALTIDELRSISKLVSRGIPVPADIQEAIDRMSSCDGLASGGALIVPETVHDDEEDRDRPADGKEKDEEDEEPGDEADGDEDDDVQHRFIKHEGGKWVIYSEKGKKLGEYGSEEEAKKRLEQIEYFKHEGERSLIEVPELPSLVNARTFEQVFHSLRQDEVEFRNLILKKMQERFDWYFGKV